DKGPQLRAERSAEKDLKPGIERVKAFDDGGKGDPRVVAHEIHSWLEEHKDAPQSVKNAFIEGVRPSLDRLAEKFSQPVDDEENMQATLKELTGAAEVAGDEGATALVKPFADAFEKTGKDD